MLPQKKLFEKGFVSLALPLAVIALLVILGGNGHMLRASGVSSQPISPDREAITTTPSSTPTPSPTPGGPSLALLPSCGNGSTAQLHVIGANWPTWEAIALFWQGSPQSIIQAGHNGSFAQTWIKPNLSVGTPQNPVYYEVRAQTNNYLQTAIFRLPCPANVTAEQPPPTSGTPTVSPTPTGTQVVPDIAVLGTPAIMSTPPLVANQPIDVAVVVRNQGGDAFNSIFFVDVFFDPAGPITNSIPISQSVGYMAVSGMAAGETRIVHVYAPQGFAGQPANHLVYGVGDSLQQIPESDESNNVSPPGIVLNVSPPPPTIPPVPTVSFTPTPTPVMAGSIGGVVHTLQSSWVAQPRAVVELVDESTGQVHMSTLSNRNGRYLFPGLAIQNYTVKVCLVTDTQTFAGQRVGIVPPQQFADVYLLPGACP